MKLFSELISCYNGGGPNTDSTEEESMDTLPPRREKVVPLTINYTSGGNIDYDMSSSSIQKSRRRRLKKLHSASNSWKPELSAILENGGVIVSNSTFSNCSTKQRSPIKSSSKTKSPIRSSSSDGDNHRESMDASSFSVFSPAPFML